MKKCSFFLLLVFMTVLSYSQKNDKNVITRDVLLTFADSSLDFSVLAKQVKIKINNALFYFCYRPDRIFINRGGVSGNLLHGKYVVYGRDKRLKEEGDFSYGLKHGAWKRWWDNGELISIVNWKNGKLDGKSYFYDQSGNLIRVASYKNGLLEGKTLVYRGKTENEIIYKDGVEVPKRVKHPDANKTNEKKKKSASGLKSSKGEPAKNDTTQLKKKKSFFLIFHKRQISDRKNDYGEKVIPKTKQAKKEKEAKIEKDK